MLNVKDNHATSFIYLAWKPKNLQGIDEVLFVVVAEIIQQKQDEEEHVNYVLQIKTSYNLLLG